MFVLIKELVHTVNVQWDKIVLRVQMIHQNKLYWCCEPPIGTRPVVYELMWIIATSSCDQCPDYRRHLSFNCLDKKDSSSDGHELAPLRRRWMGQEYLHHMNIVVN